MKRRHDPLRQPLTEPVDLLLADVAIRVQLSRANHSKAIERYETINAWIERDGSPLKDRVVLFYPQGSMAIRTTIASRLRTDEFDIDVVAQLDLSHNVSPKDALDLLFEAIRGKPGSQYYRDGGASDAVCHGALRERHACRRDAGAAHAWYAGPAKPDLPSR